MPKCCRKKKELPKKLENIYPKGEFWKERELHLDIVNRDKINEIIDYLKEIQNA